jgi:hypothetical protein
METFALRRLHRKRFLRGGRKTPVDPTVSRLEADVGGTSRILGRRAPYNKFVLPRIRHTAHRLSYVKLLKGFADFAGQWKITEISQLDVLAMFVCERPPLAALVLFAFMTFALGQSGRHPAVQVFNTLACLNMDDHDAGREAKGFLLELEFDELIHVAGKRASDLQHHGSVACQTNEEFARHIVKACLGNGVQEKCLLTKVT